MCKQRKQAPPRNNLQRDFGRISYQPFLVYVKVNVYPLFVNLGRISYQPFLVYLKVNIWPLFVNLVDMSRMLALWCRHSTFLQETTTMKLQAIFNKASEHLLSMEEPCMKASSCMYRDGVGGMCAVGAFISDEHYSQEIENVGVDNACDSRVRDRVALSMGQDALTADQLSLFAALQNVHDEGDGVSWADDIVQCLENVRNRFDLEAQS
jgi:hypothetical protein